MRKIILVLTASLFIVSTYAQIQIFNAEGKWIATVDGDGYVVSRFNEWEKLGRVFDSGNIFDAEGKWVDTVDGDGYAVSRFNEWEKLGRVSPRNMLVVAYIYFFTNLF